MLVDDVGRTRHVVQFACWRPTRTGVIFLEEVGTGGPAASRQHVLHTFDVGSRRIVPLLTLSARPSVAAGGLALSPDGRRLLFSQIDAQRSDIVLLEPFR